MVGEAETTIPILLDDYLHGRLQSVYRITEGVRARTGIADIDTCHLETPCRRRAAWATVWACNYAVYTASSWRRI